MNKSTKKTMGRPRRCREETLDRLTLTMDPKIKFGLELIARKQGRSLSRVVEWALQLAFNSFTVGDSAITLSHALDQAWSKDSEAARIREIHFKDPSFVPFDDACACKLIEESLEMSQLESNSGFSAALAAIDLKIAANWPAIRNHAIGLANKGMPLRGHSLWKIISQSESNQ